jgi:hypothetical protein
MGNTHLKPLIAVIIQSAKLTESEQKEVIIQSAELTESEQTKVCSEAHNLQANWRRERWWLNAFNIFRIKYSIYGAASGQCVDQHDRK